MPGSRRIQFALALLLALAVVPDAARAARTNWRVMTIGTFRVYSTLGDSRTRTIARELQAFSQTVGKMLEADDRLPDIPTRVYLISHADMQDYLADLPNTAGKFHHAPGENVVVVDASADFGLVKRVIFGEFTSSILREHSVTLPIWYVIGYTELFSSFRLQGNDVFVGDLPAKLEVSRVGRPWIPVERILAVKLNDPLFKVSESLMQFRGESWALVHLLLFDTPDLLSPTSAYLSSMNLSTPEPEAFASAFSFDKAALDEKLRALIRREVIHIRKFTYNSPFAFDSVAIQPLSALEADTEFARLTYLTGRPQKIIDKVVAVAVAQSPQNPDIRALAARVGAHAKAPIDIADLATKFADGGTSDEQARVDVADALLTRDTSAPSAMQALAILDGVIRGDSPSIEAVRYWAYAGRLAKLDPRRRLEVLEAASARTPHDTFILTHLAVASEELGRYQAARGYYLRIMQVSLIPTERLWAQKQTDSERLQLPDSVR